VNHEVLTGDERRFVAGLAGFAFAVEHIEIGAHELLVRVARHAGDGETVAASRRTWPTTGLPHSA
jgi:ferritin-like metal-binding protein YciE